MAKSKKYCSECGRELIFGYYRKVGGRKKLCKRCYKRLRKETFKLEVERKIALKQMKIANRLERTGMKQSYFSMFLKIFFGVTLLMSGGGFGAIIGLALLAWGIIPFIKRKKNR